MFIFTELKHRSLDCVLLVKITAKAPDSHTPITTVRVCLNTVSVRRGVLLRPLDQLPVHEHSPERDMFPGLLTTGGETIQETRDET